MQSLPGSSEGGGISRGLSAGRVVALASIALVAAVLVYLRVSDGSRPTVPSGARAGDLTLAACTYDTEDGALRADCGTLVARENRDEPDSRLIALPVVRIHARSSQPSEPIFRLEGGPGITNMEWPEASRFVADHDFVLVGYRGVDGSERLECPEVNAAIARSTDLLSERSLQAQAEATGACADRLTKRGIDITRYGLVQQVDDLEAARVALGYGRINLLSESAGTRTALIYAWRYPESIHRSVMVGVNPPGHFLWDAATFDEQVGRYGELCVASADCSSRTPDLLATIRETAARPPERWLAFPVNANNARLFSFFGLMESTSSAGPLAAPLTIEAWLSAADGDASALWLQSAFPRFIPLPFVWGQYYAAGSVDFEAARAYFASAQPHSSFAYAGTAFAWAGGRAMDVWPAARDTEQYRTPRRSEVETLLIGGALDTSTPPQQATNELLPFLPNGHQVVLPGFGHTLSVWMEQPEAGTHLITTFFDEGRVDASMYEPQRVDLTPPVGMGTMAKIAAGSMLGLVVLAMGSLAWLAARVRARGGLGRTDSILARSAYSAVLGLGGWSAAALVVLVTDSAVALDGGALAALSIGAPIGFGVFLGWTRRDRAAVERWAGLALAAGAGFAGAWLGFGAVEGVTAVLTAVAGAAIGANLALIVRDVAGEARPVETPRARAASEVADGARPLVRGG